MSLLQKADEGYLRRYIWGYWRRQYPQIYRREHSHFC